MLESISKESNGSVSLLDISDFTFLLLGIIIQDFSDSPRPVRNFSSILLALSAPSELKQPLSSGRRLNGSRRLSLKDWTIIFLVISLVKVVSVG